MFLGVNRFLSKMFAKSIAIFMPILFVCFHIQGLDFVLYFRWYIY